MIYIVDIVLCVILISGIESRIAGIALFASTLSAIMLLYTPYNVQSLIMITLCLFMLYQKKDKLYRSIAFLFLLRAILLITMYESSAYWIINEAMLIIQFGIAYGIFSGGSGSFIINVFRNDSSSIPQRNNNIASHTVQNSKRLF